MSTVILIGALLAVICIVVIAAMGQAKKAGVVEAKATQAENEANAAAKVADAAVNARPDPTSTALA